MRIVRKDIQELRGLAVLAVVINHLGINWLPGGYLGVDVFFVVSGYVITLSVLGENSVPQSRFDFLTEFWIRRIFRLWPMLFVTVSLTCIALVVTGLGLPGPVLTGVASLVAASNFRLLFGRLEYFSLDASTDWFMHTWSLAVEEQVYFTLSMTIAVLGGTTALRESRRRMKTAKSAVALMTVISLGFAMSPASTELIRFYSPHTRLYQIGAGSLLAFIQYRNQQLPRRLTVPNGRLTTSISLVALLLLFLFDHPIGRFGSLLATCITAMIIAAATQDREQTGFTRAKLLSSLGDKSYSVYLVHWPTQLMWQEIAGTGFRATAGSLTTTLALGTLGFKYVEQPTRNIWRKIALRKAAIIGAVGLVITSAVATISLVIVERSTRPPEISGLPLTCSKDTSSIWVIGDSHFTLAPQETVVSEILNGDCKFIGGYGLILDFKDLARDASGQRSLRIRLMSPNVALTQITKSQSPPKALVIVHFLTAFLSEPRFAPTSADFVAVEWEDWNGNLVTRDEFISLFGYSLTKLSRTLAGLGAVLIVTSPPPDFDWVRYPIESNRCGYLSAGRLCTKFRSEARITKAQHEARGGETRRLLDSLEKELPNFVHLRLDSPFCDESGCSNFSNGHQLYLDDDHVNLSGARLLEPYYRTVLEVVLRGDAESVD